MKIKTNPVFPGSFQAAKIQIWLLDMFGSSLISQVATTADGATCLDLVHTVFEVGSFWRPQIVRKQEQILIHSVNFLE